MLQFYLQLASRSEKLCNKRGLIEVFFLGNIVIVAIIGSVRLNSAKTVVNQSDGSLFLDGFSQQLFIKDESETFGL